MGTVTRLHDRRADWRCVKLEEPLPKEDSPLVILACLLGSILLNGGCLVLMITGAYP